MTTVQQQEAEADPGAGRTPGRSIIGIAVPMTLTEAVNVITPAVILTVVAMISDDALYVRSLYLPLSLVFIALQTGFDISTQVMAAVRTGEGRGADLIPSLGAMIRWAALVCGVLVLVLVLVVPGLTHLLHVEPDVRDTFIAFVRWTALATPFLFAPTLCAATLRGSDHPRLAAGVSTATAVLEIILVAVLGLGTPLGLFGLPVAIAVAGLLGTAVGVLLLRRINPERGPRTPVPYRDTSLFLRDVGVPIAGSFALLAANSFALVWILSSFPAKIVSGFAVASSLQSVVLVPALSIGSATAIVMNRQIGAGKRASLRSSLHAGLRIAGWAYLVLAGVIWAARDVLAGWIAGDAGAAAVASQYLGVVAPTFLILGVTLAAITIIEQIGGGFFGLALNLVYFGGTAVVGNLALRWTHDPVWLYRTIAGFNLLGLGGIALAVAFGRRRAEALELVPPEPVPAEPGHTRRSEDVAFVAEPERSGPATWGQRHVWRDVSWQPPGSAYNVVQPYRPGADLVVTSAEIIAVVRELVVRHESLRTLLRLDGGALTQRVLARGTVRVDVLTSTASTRDEFVAFVTETVAALEDEPFDVGAEPGFRVAIFEAEQTPRFVLLVFSHFAADQLAARILGAELDERLRGRAGAPVVARQPIDQAAHEESPAGQAVLAANLRYWRNQLRAVPRTLFTGPVQPAGSPRYRRGELRSTAATGALRTLSARYHTGTSTVLLAVVSALLAGVARLPRVGLQTIASNRYDPETKAAIGNLTQDVLVTVEVAGRTFPEVVKAAWRASLNGYRHGAADDEQVANLVADVGRERGVVIDLSVYFNDVRFDDAADTAETARPEPADGTFRWDGGSDVDRLTFFFEAFDSPETPAETRFVLTVDTTLVPAADVPAFLHGVEKVLVSLVDREVAADEMVALAGLQVPERGDRWLPTDHGWVQLDEVERLVSEAVPGSRVTVSAGSAGAIVAEVVAPRSSAPSADVVRERCLELLDRYPAAVVPGEIRLADADRPANDPAI